MKIALASDHAGWRAKEQLRQVLVSLGHAVQDFGCASEDPCDYPDTGIPAARTVSEGQCDRAILICGTGIGMSIAANKMPGIRAATCHNAATVTVSRSHNDSNVLCLGARELSEETIAELAQTWLDTPFDGGRHARRLAKIKALEESR